ncbi:dynamin family protein [Rhodobacteraceae bacterium D3-12]|nr:dynamin family protein [Rhodobacteraceae bacterium D3-12]
MKINETFEAATEIRPSGGSAKLRTGMEELETFASEALALEGALDRLGQLAGEQSRRTVTRLKQQLAAFEPSVTVLGQVKSGKTSLINAMAGWTDLLPSDVNPWTSVVTSLHLTPAEERAETGASFQFMTEEEWDRLTDKGGRIGELAGRAGSESELSRIQDQIETMRDKSRARLGRNFELLMGQQHEFGYFDKNLLERYICLGDDFDEEEAGAPEDEQGRFADITRSAELYLNCRSVPFRMCLRDTPGVNDTFMMREMVTIRALRDSRICVVVLSASQALTSVDMALIRMISNLKSREVIIFVNRIDELSDPANQMTEIEDSIRNTLANHDGPKDAEIIFGSAYWAGKVLNDELGDMHEASADALLKLTKAVLGSTELDQSPASLVWEISGLPMLMQALSSQIVTSLGVPCLKKVASSAVAIASSQTAARSVMVESDDFEPEVALADMAGAFEKLETASRARFDRAMSAILAAYCERADRVHNTFIERATHSLLEHLERYGELEVWEYDPAGLRILLRSTYSTMGARMRKEAMAQYEATVSEVALLLYRGFGPVVEGVQIGVPEAPAIPSPVALGQTIALDFNDSWWVSWWRRRRGYKAFAKQFQDLIRAETEDFMTQMKVVQTSQIRDALEAELVRFLAEQKAILFDLISQGQGDGDVEDRLLSMNAQGGRAALESTLDELRGYAA